MTNQNYFYLIDTDFGFISCFDKKCFATLLGLSINIWKKFSNQFNYKSLDLLGGMSLKNQYFDICVDCVDSNSHATHFIETTFSLKNRSIAKN